MKVCPDCKQLYPDEASFCYAEGSSLEAPAEPRLGTILVGRYIVGDLLGQGRFAKVYRAQDELSGRFYAAKVFHGPPGDPRLKEIPRRASMQVRRVPHPNLVDMVDDGETEDGAMFVLMELCDGQKLSDVLKIGKLSVNKALRLAADILRGLSRTHDFAVVHWDLKPSNVFILKSGMAKLRNFGLVRALEGTFGQTAKDYPWLTTQAYLAPERAGPFGDLYSVGVILFEALTGKLPYQADDAATMIAKHRGDPVPSIAERGVNVPPAFDALVQSLMAKSPAGRPVNANAALAQVMEIARSLSVELPEPPMSPAPMSATPVFSASQKAWDRRIGIFDEMVKRAFPSGPPPHVSRSLEDMRAKIKEISELRARLAEHQQTLDTIEASGRESLLRIGEAMTTIMTEATGTLSEARAAQGAVSEDLSGRLTDLDYQVKDLRTALNNEITDLDERRAEWRTNINNDGKKVAELMSDVMTTAPRFCAPLRANPELVPLFGKLL
ncbi:MAG: protein kinase [Polyangiaceae bacterium]